MNRKKTMITGIFLAMAVLVTLLFTSHLVWAHCDTLNGPVVVEAKAALEKGDVTPLLKWVTKEHEAEIKTAFKKTLVVRTKGPEAKELADMYFFETLVRIHRAGEGAPYTGLKPAGHVEPPVAAADRAIEVGSVDELAKNIGQAAEKAVKERFELVMDAMKHKDESVEAGRKYVAAYVIFVHYVEGLHNTIQAGGAHGHGEEGQGEEHGH
ncbi:MAG TPA: hypothetical protein ENN40_10520 [Candidatus Aminicenantes bacterium]|nr:hypothetical protein [Candidatus Aminicenantes bacterium]